MKYHIRWMLRRDMTTVLEIEKASFPNPWEAKDFIDLLRERDCIGMCCEADESVIGFMLYRLHPRRIELLNLAIDPKWRSQFAGTAMLAKLRGKLCSDRRNRISADVRESNVAALNWFKSQGFRLTNVMLNAYEDAPDDCYTMTYTLRRAAYLPENRIGKLGAAPDA